MRPDRIHRVQRAGIGKTRAFVPRRSLSVLGLLLLWQIGGCGGPDRAVPGDPNATPHPGNFTVDITDEQRAVLVTQARADLDASHAIIDKIDRKQVSSQITEKLKTIDSLMVAAAAAEKNGDVSAMANLARKAHLLAAELPVE